MLTTNRPPCRMACVELQVMPNVLPSRRFPRSSISFLFCIGLRLGLYDFPSLLLCDILLFSCMSSRHSSAVRFGVFYM